MKTVLITGGAGDWANSFKTNFSSKLNIINPGKEELNVTSIASVSSYIDNMNVDILINNAGTIHPKRILESNVERWINDINVNLVGAYLAAKAVLQNEPAALIINISSTAGFNYYPDWSSYCASKAALITFTKCLANDDFNSFCLCPGGFDTKFRNNFNLDNSNLMDCEAVSDHIIKIIDGEYNSGDVIAFGDKFFALNPSWDL